jgi:hypothetical protein
MENVHATDLLTRICATRQQLHPSQHDNISEIISLSKEFGKEAHLPLPQSFFTTDCNIVIESGHQPNFLPYTGILKKVFLLHWISRHMTDQGFHPIALFGFADQNLSTASYLSENIIPSSNKSGSEKIGFKIREKDRWKCFNTINKPPFEQWQKEMEKIHIIYQKQRKSDNAGVVEIKNRADRTLELLENSYQLADNFADLNAFFFSKLCVEVFGLNVFFFRYSDIQKKSIFAEELRDLASHRIEYIHSYNAAIAKFKLPLHGLSEDHVPFWYHCECGGNVPLVCSEVAAKGTCPSCGKEHLLSYENDDRQFCSHIPAMSLTAVARNLIFAKGLGSSIFISGSGGGLEYGRLSDAVARDLRFPIPVTLAWASRDYYFGQIHSSALIDFLKMFKITSGDLIQSSAVMKIRQYRNNIRDNILEYSSNPADKKKLQKYQGQYNNSTIQMEIIKKIFSVTPSMLDIIINVSSESLLGAWNKSVEEGLFFGKNETYKMQKDTTYHTYNLLNVQEIDIPLIYRNIQAIEVNLP